MKIAGKSAASGPSILLAGLLGASGCGELTGSIDLGGDRDSGVGASAGNTNPVDPGTGGRGGSGSSSDSSASGGTVGNGAASGNAGASGASDGATGTGSGGASGTSGSGSGGSNGVPDGGSNESLWLQATRGISDMKIDATHLYWVTDGVYEPPSAWRAALQGGTPERLAAIVKIPAPTDPPPENARVYSLAIDDNYAYLTHTDAEFDRNGGSIIRLLKQGGQLHALSASLFNPTKVTVDETHVYFNAGSSPDGEIRRVPKSGGPDEVILTGIDNPWDFVVDSTHLYISEQNRGYIGRVPKAGDPVLGRGAYDVLAMQNNATSGLALSGSFVYYVGCDQDPCAQGGMHPYRVPRTGGNPEQLALVPANQPKPLLGPVVARAGFVVSLSWLWPANGGAPINLLPAEQPTTVAANDDYVYLGVHASGKIFRVRNPLANP